jgi:anti-sigma factor RsiW
MNMESTAPECQPFRDAASDYLDGYINDHDRADFDEHLNTCAACDEFMDEFRATLSLLSELREPSVARGEEANAAHSYIEYFPEPDLPPDLADWTSVKQTWGELAGLTPEARLLTIREGRYLDPLLCDWLVVRAKKVSSVNPGRAVLLAEAGLEIARQRDSRFGDPKRLMLALGASAACFVMLREFALASGVLQELGDLCNAESVSSVTS